MMESFPGAKHPSAAQSDWNRHPPCPVLLPGTSFGPKVPVGFSFHQKKTGTIPRQLAGWVGSKQRCMLKGAFGDCSVGKFSGGKQVTG